MRAATAALRMHIVDSNCCFSGNCSQRLDSVQTVWTPKQSLVCYYFLLFFQSSSISFAFARLFSLTITRWSPHAAFIAEFIAGGGALAPGDQHSFLCRVNGRFDRLSLILTLLFLLKLLLPFLCSTFAFVLALKVATQLLLMKWWWGWWVEWWVEPLDEDAIGLLAATRRRSGRAR